MKVPYRTPSDMGKASFTITKEIIMKANGPLVSVRVVANSTLRQRT